MTNINRHNIFDNIRNGFAFVAAHADYVTIAYDKIETYASQLPDAPPQNLFDLEHHYTGPLPDVACYVLALDAVNFGSGYEPLMQKEGLSLIDDSVYFTMATRLKHAFDQKPLTASDLVSIEADQFRNIMGLPDAPISRKYADLCVQALGELGQAITNDADGDAYKFVMQFNGDVGAFVARMAQIPMFSDIHNYKGHSLPVLKRAQIAACDLHLAFAQQGVSLFNNMDRLTMFADNAVPHVLRVGGLLQYNFDLASRIDGGDMIIVGSPEECEMRACAGHVVELLAAQKQLRAIDIDHILWHKSEEDPIYRKSSPHRCLTHYY
jgi:hypothetical protein